MHVNAGNTGGTMEVRGLESSTEMEVSSTISDKRETFPVAKSFQRMSNTPLFDNCGRRATGTYPVTSGECRHIRCKGTLRAQT